MAFRLHKLAFLYEILTPFNLLDGKCFYFHTKPLLIRFFRFLFIITSPDTKTMLFLRAIVKEILNSSQRKKNCNLITPNEISNKGT